MTKYSVIIPAYNSEKTIARCLESLASQGREDVQIVVVNDGSTDRSEAVILELAEKYPAIAYVFQENAGVSCARNTGLEHARGTYVTFVDSDDYVAQDYFAALDTAGDCDLLAFCHEIVGDDPRDMGELFGRLENLDSFGERLELLLSSRRIMSPWDKRFKREIIEAHAVRFPKNMQIGEDFNFCMAYAMHCSTLEVLNRKIIYNDITDQGSLSRKYRPDLDDQMVRSFTAAAQTLRNAGQAEDLKRRLLAVNDYLFVKHTFSCICELYKVKSPSRAEIHAICRKFRTPLAEDRCGIVHTGLRLLLKLRVYFPFALVSYLAKGRRLRKNAKGENCA